ncbi:LysR substrate-binding domain-containing protein [Arthrobacter sp. JCM 19049]|uniref:LysR substrate-binding domain-containing protein n=1 Tax=Arthrobacter sp. JCM 19049 TaxID=1460643 RepID=UPI0027956A19|nr:LysR substrate-binding domain-containing protein [Arthrobacter sp. JCM 19049]
MCISLVAMVLGEFHRRYPGIELHLSEAGSRLLLEQLSAGQLDLAWWWPPSTNRPPSSPWMTFRCSRRSSWSLPPTPASCRRGRAR